MNKSGWIDRIKSGVAQDLRGLIDACPAWREPVWREPSWAQGLMAGIAAFTTRRRRSIAAVVILAFHAVVLAGLAVLPTQPPPTSLIYLDLSPIAGGGSAAIEGRPTPPSSVPDTSPPSKPKADAISDAPSKPPLEDGPLEDGPPEEGPPEDGQPDDAQPDDRQPQDAQPDAAKPASPSGADVLAMVETITGADAATLSRPVPPTPAAETFWKEISRQHAASRAGHRGGGCSIDATLRTGLSQDPVVQAALASIPSTDTSVSNALQLWDGHWTGTEPPDARRAGAVSRGVEDVLAPVRAFTVAIIEAAPADCRNAWVQGPRFLVVPLQDAAPMVVVIGSGEWRWRDLLPERRPALFRWLGLPD